MKYCTKCFMPDTRPRITFNQEGVCNACQWSEAKKSIDWDARRKYFDEVICAMFRNRKSPNCIVPWSGGKDSIYVAYKMREFGMEPLLMTVLPHMETEIGEWNRTHMCPGFEKFEINLKEEKYKMLAKNYFIAKGKPKHPWETAISAVVMCEAAKLNIPFIIYGEEGEAEYGGVSREADRWFKPVDKEYLMKYYYHNNLDWSLPEGEAFDRLFFTQWSRFENWCPSEHGNFAVAKGMRTEGNHSIGTLSSISQLSDKLQDLHMFLCFLKFGFGRSSADESIAIRDGWRTREEALEIVMKHDGIYPYKYHEEYLDYFGMTASDFEDVLDFHANTEIVEKKGSEWFLKTPIA